MIIGFLISFAIIIDAVFVIALYVRNKDTFRCGNCGKRYSISEDYRIVSGDLVCPNCTNNILKHK